MKAEWVPSEPLLIYPDIAQEVAQAENLFQCAAAAHLLLAQEILTDQPDDEAAQANAEEDMHQAERMRQKADEKGAEKLAEIKARLATETDEASAETMPAAAELDTKTAESAKPKTLAQTYFAQALSFYDAVTDERFAAERTNRMPSEAMSRRNWASANTQMAEFAFEQGDLVSATEYYTRIEDPIQQWKLVAKVHGAHPILATQWERPLVERIENNEFDTLTTLAMYKAGVAMRFNQLATIPKDAPEYTTLQDEIRGVWFDAKQLLDKELEQQTMGPWNNSYKPVLAGYDVREHLIAFAELFYERGDMRTAQEVTKALTATHRKAKTHEETGAEGVNKETEDFLVTTELRERCYGRTWDEVTAQAKDWLRDNKLSPETRVLCAAIVQTQNPGIWDKQIIKHLPKINYAKEQAVTAYIEATYEGVAFEVAADLGYGGRADIPQLLQTNKPGADFLKYYRLLANAGSYEQANAPSQRVAMFERFQAALSVTKQAEQIEKSGVADTTTHLLGNIELIMTDFSEQHKHVMTDELPDLQLEILSQLDPYIRVERGIAELDEKLYGALLDALTIVAPKGSATTDQLYEKVKKHCELQLSALKAIPDETITGPRAETIKALLARVTQK